MLFEVFSNDVAYHGDAFEDTHDEIFCLVSFAELITFKDAGHLGCRDQCNVLWDGYGAWEREHWEPYTPGKTRSFGEVLPQRSDQSFLLIFAKMNLHPQCC